MSEVRGITGAEGGSLYIYDRVSETLKVVVLTNEVLRVHSVVETFDPLRIDGFIEIPMRNADGELNVKNISVCCFHQKETILIPDINTLDERFDLSKTRDFDEKNDYTTRNLAVFPLVGHGDQLIGVLQLVNADDTLFLADMHSFIDALVGQISIVLNNALLVSEAQNLLSAIVSMVSVAIDEKSPHTAGHCQRVTELSLMVADAMNKSDDGAYADFWMDDEKRRELRMAAMLHDIGKIITPAHIMEKPTKLHTLYDKVNLLRERLRAWYLSEQLRRLEKMHGEKKLFSEDEIAAYQADCDFLEGINRGEILADEEALVRLSEMSNRIIDFDESKLPGNLILEEEAHFLKIPQGTLDEKERKIMEGHVSASVRMLSSIPWPRNLERVVEYAGNHHEAMNGKGYPNGLTGDQMSLPARILGMVDRFEAISAPDRPYRKVKVTLSRVMNIMQKMAEDSEIDPELFAFFKEKKVYMDYARKYLPADLIDCA